MLARRHSFTFGVVGLAVALALALTGCGSGATGAFETATLAPGAEEVSIGQQTAGDYRIKTDDILSVFVYQVQDFNRDAQVDAAGNIALPLLGSVPAAGRSVREIESDITRRLKAKYLQNPQVSVIVKDAVGLRVTVTGAVQKPGVLQLRGYTTLTSVLAQSGGFTDTADHSDIVVFRNTTKGRAAARFDADAILKGAPDPEIHPGDTVSVDDSIAKTAWKNTGSALGIVGVFHLLF